MEKQEIDKIRGWFDQTFEETYRIRQQNVQTHDWMEPTYLNVRKIYDMCEDIGQQLTRLDKKLRDIETRIEKIEATID